MKQYEFVVVGGGMVGAAIAFGLASAGHQVAVLDEGDNAYRAARGNFGLAWVQGKGIGLPEYSLWTQSSSRLWPDFANELEDITGIDVGYEGGGGVHICRTEEDMSRRKSELSLLKQQTGGSFTFEMLEHKQLAEILPAIGNHVAGASWCMLDGHTNPLFLLHALLSSVQKLGGKYLPNSSVDRIEAETGGYRLKTQLGDISSMKVVLAAGLGNVRLGRQVGLDVPLKANRGQVMITERAERLLDTPTTFVRQTGDGTIQLGDSHEDVGMNDGTLTTVLSDIARRGLDSFPCLNKLRVVRAWGCLRVMTRDGFPIYSESSSNPGVFLACCHSGVTLAAAHAKRLPEWIAKGQPPQEILALNKERF